jgi:O-antigen ligase
MRWVGAAIVLLIPLALAPRVFFYYDVTPKAAVLLFATLALLLWVAWKPATSLSFMTSRWGRWNAALAGVFILLTVIAAASSPYVSLAWNGSNWRRWGALGQIATVVCALLLAAIARSAASARIVILRALCLAGVIAALYGILQYFGWDPLVPRAVYLVGEGVYQIVRPPGPLGHSDYFAAFLLWPVFVGAGLWIVDQRAGRWLGAAAVATGVAALLLAGSRGALVGLFAGTVILIWQWRIRLRLVAAIVALAAISAAVFYISPAGARLRARAFWISEDPTGGARPLLWRDTARMAASRPWTGFGPDTFVAEFPQYQSAELARAYPDFYHESPHNMFLDVLTGQGLAAMVLLVAWIGLAFTAGLKTPSKIAGALLAGLGAAVVAQQFVVFMLPTALVFYLGIGLLSGLEPSDGAAARVRLRPAIAFGGTLAALVLAVVGYRLVADDVTLGRIRALLDAGQGSRAADVWKSTKNTHLGGVSSGISADLYFSRRWAEAASNAADPLDKIRFGALAIEAAQRAATIPEQRQNAWYNCAILAAAMNDPNTVESSLRAAIQAGPRWFKPHWALARLLNSQGRSMEAREEAGRALDLGGNKFAEVADTMAEIIR